MRTPHPGSHLCVARSACRIADQERAQLTALKSDTSPLTVTWDPREQAPQTDLEAQLAFSLRVRDTISKLTGLVHSLQSVREQLRARAAALR